MSGARILLECLTREGVDCMFGYPGGVTLRFARVLRYREDKRAAEADTLDAVRALSHRGRGDAI